MAAPQPHRLQPPKPKQKAGPKQKKQRNLSPATRKKLSEAAKKRHARGEFGGSEFGRLGGRPRKRVSTEISDSALEHAEQIKQVFIDGLDADQNSQAQRLKTVDLWLTAASREDKAAREDKRDDEKLSRDQTLELLVAKFTSGPMAAMFRQQVANLAEQEEIGDGNIIDAEIATD